MPRPENAINWGGPVADLARELRQIRARAGMTYRMMESGSYCSHSVLAAAAAGNHCPTWKVTEAFVRACGESDLAPWRGLWEKAQATSRRSDSRVSPPRRTAPPTPPASMRPSSRSATRRETPPPDPWRARTPTEYVRQLRALRAWAGKPGVQDIARGGVEIGLLRDPGAPRWSGGLLPSSTVYDALNPNRGTLPQLRIVKMIVHACGADVEVWTAAWQALAMIEFEAGNPPLPAQNDRRDSGTPPTHNIRLAS